PSPLVSYPAKPRPRWWMGSTIPPNHPPMCTLDTQPHRPNYPTRTSAAIIALSRTEPLITWPITILLQGDTRHTPQPQQVRNSALPRSPRRPGAPQKTPHTAPPHKLN
ncbi:hypothetical protein VOLCADRAFT_86853, partial [Volvox carteri f. nagariensis]